MRCQVLTAVKLTLFWASMPCELVRWYKCFGEIYPIFRAGFYIPEVDLKFKLLEHFAEFFRCH